MTKKPKYIKPSDLYIGQLVVVTEHPEAQVYTIGEISQPYGAVSTVWFEGERKCISTADMFSLMTPTMRQVEYNIAAHGRLASGRDI